MNELIVIGTVIVVLAVCFVAVRLARHKPSHGGGNTYWVINPNQQGTKKAYKGYGLTRPHGKYCIPLNVTEAPDKFEKTPKRKRATRYFERD